MELDDTLDSFSYWVASDIFEEGGIPDSPLSCTYGMLTIHGIPKASANAFVLLNKLVGESLELQTAGLPQHVGMHATREGDKIHLLAWYFNPHETPTSDLSAYHDTLDVSAILKDASSRALRIAIEPGRGSVNEAWEALGAPRNLSRQEEDFLHAAAVMDYQLRPVQEAKLTLNLKPGDLVYYEIAPLTDGTTLSRDGDFATWDSLMGEKSQ